MKLIKIPRSVLFLICTTPTLLISGCSSGNNNSRPSAHAVTTPESQVKDIEVAKTTISGNVIKGAVKNADVYFYQVNNNQVGDTPFANVKTDESGSFTLDIPSKSLTAVVYVEVQGAADGSSTMTCDAEACGMAAEGEDKDGDGVIGFGESLRLSSDFKLSTAITDFKNTDKLELSVTPLSHFAVQRARKKGDMGVGAIDREMGELAALLNLPAALSQLLAMDITEVIEENYQGDADPVIVEYSLYSAAVAGYAHKHRLSLETAITRIEAELYDAEGKINRELVLDLLRLAHREANRVIRGNNNLHRLITQIQRLIGRYECPPMSGGCGPIDPPPMPEPPASELAKVKSFVSDFRTWVRELTMQNNPALSNFQSRMQMVGKVWEDDVKVLASALNDVLPGIGQTLSPTYAFCYYCEQEDGVMFFAAAAEKELTIGNLHYLLSSDGTLDIEGSIRDVDVDMQLQLPAPEDWSSSHGIEIVAGRLSRDNMDLVISKGSVITADFDEGIAFEDLIAQIESGATPIAREVSANLNFFIEAEYGIAPGGVVDFESGASVPEWLDVGAWQVTDAKAQSGSNSLKSAPIGNNASTRAEANIETLGGYLSFSYAVESEASYDFFNVYVDGNRVLSVSGYQPEFKNTQIFLAPGEHTIIWEYRKDASVGHNKDAVWIDNIQFPALVAAGEQELVSHNILDGQMSVTAHKLDEPWQFTSQMYLPGDIQLNAVFSNNFLAVDEIGQDEITLNLAANIANAADFEPPQPYEEGTLDILGNYTVAANLFTFNLRNWSIRITPAGNQTYLYEVYRTGEDEPFQSELRTSTKTAMKDVAGELITNSGIGFDVVVPNEGLYITTLLKSSPWGVYKDSRFSAEGGNIYGYLVEPFDPTETEEQFLEISVAFEMGVKPYDLPEVIFGSQFTRDTLNEGTFEFYLIVDGHRFNFDTSYWYNLIQFDNNDASVDLISPELTIENHNGVKLVLVFADIEDATVDKVERVLEGELVYNGRVYGTIKRVKGITAIEYIDGTGESIE